MKTNPLGKKPQTTRELYEVLSLHNGFVWDELSEGEGEGEGGGGARASQTRP